MSSSRLAAALSFAVLVAIPASGVAATLQIQSATGHADGKHCNVADVVKRECEGKSRCGPKEEDPKFWCEDPAPGTPKTLTIGYCCGSNCQSTDFAERHGKFNYVLECP